MVTSTLGAAPTIMPLYVLQKWAQKKWPVKGFQRFHCFISSAKGLCCSSPFLYQHHLFVFLSPRGMPMSPLPFILTQPQPSPAQTSRALTALVTSSRRQFLALKDEMGLMALKTYFEGHSISIASLYPQHPSQGNITVHRPHTSLVLGKYQTPGALSGP